MKLGNMPVVLALGATKLNSDDEIVLEVFVASRTKDGDECLSWGSWVRNIERAVCAVAGGCTRHDGIGSWVNPETKQLVCESTAVIRAFVSRHALVAGAPGLRQVLVQYGRECEQHTVGFAVNGEFFGIDPSLPY